MQHNSDVVPARAPDDARSIAGPHGSGQATR